MQRTDAKLLSWWARCCEARGEYGKALNAYQRTGAHTFCTAQGTHARRLWAAEPCWKAMHVHT